MVARSMRYVKRNYREPEGGARGAPVSPSDVRRRRLLLPWAPGRLAIVFQDRDARLEPRYAALETVGPPRLLAQPPLRPLAVKGHRRGEGADLAAKRLPDDIEVATRLGVARSDLTAKIRGQLVEGVTKLGVHGPSLAALPRLVNVAARIHLWGRRSAGRPRTPRADRGH